MWSVIMLVAIWSIYIQDGHINRDGLLYLKQAYLIAEGSWKEGLALYPWPFFSILIAIFHKFTNLHFQVVAHGVDLALFGIAILFYLKTLQLIYNKEKHIIFYGGVILLSFIPIMDDYVGMVLRDHGLWAGCMMGTYFYSKNLKQYSLKNSITWQLGFLFAGLFRPEGLVFVILLPLWNLTQNKTQKLKQLVLDYSLCILAAILALLVILFSNIDLMNVMSSSRLTEFLNRPILFLQQLVKPLPVQTDNEYLSNLFENYSLIITYAVLFSVLIFKWIKGLGVLHGGLFFYSLFAKKKIKNNYQKYIYFFLIVSFILVSINLFNVYVLTNRYWGFHWWWIFILITPVILIIFKDGKVNRFIKKILGITIAFFILNCLIDKNESLEQEVADYLKENALQQVDFQEHQRIKYYVNYSIQDLVKDENNQSSPLYKLYKINNVVNIDQKIIIKNFPETKTKFILTKHAQ
ncbi:hypothetical protein VI34_06380 [Methylophilales bacterium MBRSG12]|nr:hypothetical protein UZ34_03945 [Methylophilales bacterium MBRSF5]AKO67605.1 hypothetical protein VI34_06380 [Methylophilales bacterium MBRSG12]